MAACFGRTSELRLIPKTEKAHTAVELRIRLSPIRVPCFAISSEARHPVSEALHLADARGFYARNQRLPPERQLTAEFRLGSKRPCHSRVRRHEECRRRARKTGAQIRRKTKMKRMISAVLALTLLGGTAATAAPFHPGPFGPPGLARHDVVRYAPRHHVWV